MNYFEQYNIIEQNNEKNNEQNNNEKNNIELDDQSLLHPVSMVNCSICLSEILPQENNLLINEVVRLQCGHAFHTQCIRPWLRTNNICPNCRYSNDSTENETENETESENIYDNHQFRITMSLLIMIIMFIKLIILYNLFTNDEATFNAKIVGLCVILPFILLEIGMILALILKVRIRFR